MTPRLLCLEPARRPYELTRAWTRMEAYLKATGAGLRDLWDLAVASGTEEVRPSPDDAAVRWRVSSLGVPRGYAAAVAVPEHVTDVTVRPTIDRVDFTAARRSDLEEMRREIYPLARRLAARLTKEQHARRRGPLDVRRTVRASLSTGGVPLTTHHRPKRPRRTELVVLCDVSGSVANFAQFTLLLVFALREQFTKVRAFTFVDQVHEVTHHFRPGADVGEVMADLVRGEDPFVDVSGFDVRRFAGGGLRPEINII